MSITVRFARSEAEHAWDPKAENLLDFAENLGFDPDYGCRAGNCFTCECKVIEGETEYIHEIFDEPEDGSVLICSARPKTNVVLDL